MAKVKIKFIKGHPRYAYFVGDEVIMENARAKDLVDGEFAVIVAKPSVKKAAPKNK